MVLSYNNTFTKYVLSEMLYINIIMYIGCHYWFHHLTLCQWETWWHSLPCISHILGCTPHHSCERCIAPYVSLSYTYIKQCQESPEEHDLHLLWSASSVHLQSSIHILLDPSRLLPSAKTGIDTILSVCHFVAFKMGGIGQGR